MTRVIYKAKLRTLHDVAAEFKCHIALAITNGKRKIIKKIKKTNVRAGYLLLEVCRKGAFDISISVTKLAHLGRY